MTNERHIVLGKRVRSTFPNCQWRLIPAWKPNPISLHPMDSYSMHFTHWNLCLNIVTKTRQILENSMSLIIRKPHCFQPIFLYFIHKIRCDHFTSDVTLNANVFLFHLCNGFGRPYSHSYLNVFYGLHFCLTALLCIFLHN